MLAIRSYTRAHQHGRGTDPADAEDALVFKGVRLVSEIATYDWSGGTPVMVALVPDGLWEVIEPLLPLPKPKPQGGRPRLPDRACLIRIVFVLRSGIPWEMLPKELGCGSGMLEAHARLAGVWHLAVDPLFTIGLALSFQSDRLVQSCGG